MRWWPAIGALAAIAVIASYPVFGQGVIYQTLPHLTGNELWKLEFPNLPAPFYVRSGQLWVDAPVATATTTGVVKPDNSTIVVAPDGTISSVGSGTGNVSGPASAVSGNIPGFSGTTGKILLDSGLATNSLVTLTGAQSLTNKTIAGAALSGTFTGAPTVSGNLIFSGVPQFTGLSASTQVSCLGLDSGNSLVLNAAACGTGGSTGANPTATAGPTAINGSASTFLRSDGAPAIQLGTAAQKGIVQVDGTTITASAGVISAANGSSPANPSATAGPAAVNGSASTFMRSDAAPAIQLGTSSQKGLLQVDGTTISAASGVINSNWAAQRVVHDGTANATIAASDFNVSLGSTAWTVGRTFTFAASTGVVDGKRVRIMDDQQQLAGNTLTLAAGGSDTLVGTTALNATGGATDCYYNKAQATVTCWPAISNSALTGQLFIGQGPTSPGAWVTIGSNVTLDNIGTATVIQVGALSTTGGVPTRLASGTLLETRNPILGVAGTASGSIAFENATSGRITVSPPAGALGTVALTWPTTAGALTSLAGANTWTAGQATTPSAGGTVTTTATPDASVANDFTYTLGATGLTMANPTSLRAGETINLFLTQDGTGSRTITTWGSAYKFSGGTKPTLSTAAGAVDLVSCRSSTTSFLVCTFTSNVS